MADTGIFATTAEVQRKVGANASTTANTEAYINDFMAQNEAYINAYCNYDFSTAYPSLNIKTKAILKKWASAASALDVLSYDESNFSRLLGYQTRMNKLAYEVDECKSILSKLSANQFVRQGV